MAGITNMINQVSEDTIDIGLLRDVILNSIGINDNLFIRGAPGIGKTEIVQQVADEINKELLANPNTYKFLDRQGNECCYELIEIRMACYAPEDISGLPQPVVDSYGVKRTAFSLPMDFPSDPNWKGIIFLDEFDQTQPAVMNACYKMIQDRMINDWHFPKGTTFIAAGNGKFSVGYQNELPSALKNRFTNINVEGNLDSWIAWAIKNGIHPSIIGFLKSQHPELYIDKVGLKDGEDSFATPRGWAVVSKILNSKCSDKIKKIQINGRIGYVSGNLFWNYYEKESKLPNFEEILCGRLDIDDSNLDIFYNTIIGCLTTICGCSDDTLRVEYINNMCKTINKLNKNENVVFFLKLISQLCRMRDLDESDEYMKLFSRCKNFIKK